MVSVPSLRSLCLQKVSSLSRDKEGYEDNASLTQELVNELKIMRLFNGTYSNVGVSQFVVTDRSLSILYDGDSWSFDNRTMMSSFMGFPIDNATIRKFKLDQGKPVKAVSMLYEFKDVMDTLHNMIEDSKAPDPKEYVMKMTIKIDRVDWKVGRLIFTGPRFQFVLRVNIDREGKKVLSHHAVVKLDGHENDYQYVSCPIRLEETWEDIRFPGVRKELEEVEVDLELGGKGLGDPEHFGHMEFVEEGLLLKFFESIGM